MTEDEIDIGQQIIFDIARAIDNKPAVSILTSIIAIINNLHSECFNNSIEDFAENNKKLLIDIHYHKKKEKTIQ